MAIGRTPAGPAGWDPRYAPHLLVVGDTGSGKSSAIRAILAVWHWDAVLLDPKVLEFGGWPVGGRVLCSTGSPVGITSSLRRWADEVDTRMQALAGAGATHWSDPEASTLGFGPVLVVLDEAAVALSRPAKEETPKETKDRTEGARQALLEVLVLGRACGVHVVIGLQRPDAAFLGGAARDQLRGRIALGHLSPDGSRMMFDADHSDQMTGQPGYGLAVNLTPGMSAPVPFQSAWISPTDTRALYAPRKRDGVVTRPTDAQLDGRACWLCAEQKGPMMRFLPLAGSERLSQIFAHDDCIRIWEAREDKRPELSMLQVEIPHDPYLGGQHLWVPGYGCSPGVWHCSQWIVGSGGSCVAEAVGPPEPNCNIEGGESHGGKE